MPGAAAETMLTLWARGPVPAETSGYRRSMHSTLPSANSAQQRLHWADLARAISIILVVGYHTGVSAVYDLLPRDLTDASELWRSANQALLPLRMPLFFVVSGMLAVGAIGRPWFRVARPRVTNMLWAYVLWTVIFAVTAWARYAPDDPWGYMTTIVMSAPLFASPYWFIAVLPLFFLVTRCGRNRIGLLLAVLFLSYLLSPFLETWIEAAGSEFTLVAVGARRLTEYGLWFALGYALVGPLQRFGERGRPVLAFVALAASLPLLHLVLTAELEPAVRRVMQLLATLTSVSGVLALTTVIASVPAAASLGRFIGGRTLMIYLVHPLFLNVVVVGLREVYGRDWMGTSLWADVLLVPVVTASAIVVSLGAKAASDRVGSRWLVEAPWPRREMRNSEQARRPSS